MSRKFELANLSQQELATNQEDIHRNVWRYSCELGSQNVEPTILPRIPARYALESFDQWLSYLEDSEDQLGYTADWVRETIHQIPGGIDIARDVDDGGFTEDMVRPTMFTAWVALEDGTHVRFSEARTAMHNTMLTTKGIAQGGALRSPVMQGVALEATCDPLSTDPRDAVTLAIYEFAREEVARCPWLDARPGRLFDFTQFTEIPFYVGPLYGGHPNQVTDPQAISKAIDAATFTLQLVVETNLGNE